VPAKTDDTEILYMTVSNNEKKIGVALGVNVIKDQYKVTELAIYIKNEDMNRYELEKCREF